MIDICVKAYFLRKMSIFSVLRNSQIRKMRRICVKIRLSLFGMRNIEKSNKKCVEFRLRKFNLRKLWTYAF